MVRFLADMCEIYKKTKKDCYQPPRIYANGLTYKHCLVYPDDLIIYSRTFNEHLGHLNEIFDRLIAAGRNLIPGKCQFASNKVS
ncbi:unnamed protein product [Brachionus calyciflorus]|uniref:Reverse transcriptase domain-containing protein n=1 Tax=Brachionus calyciflorus TaxID=104777 RepID=A0A814LXV9_9BILA|nr:unnamed protein product [Brachionus calyciflorus]